MGLCKYNYYLINNIFGWTDTRRNLLILLLLDLTAIWSGFNFKIQFFSFNDFDSAVFFNNINVWLGSLHCLSKKRIIRRRKSESLFWAIFGSISFFLFWQYLFFPDSDKESQEGERSQFKGRLHRKTILIAGCQFNLCFINKFGHFVCMSIKYYSQKQPSLPLADLRFKFALRLQSQLVIWQIIAGRFFWEKEEREREQGQSDKGIHIEKERKRERLG